MLVKFELLTFELLTFELLTFASVALLAFTVELITVSLVRFVLLSVVLMSKLRSMTALLVTFSTPQSLKNAPPITVLFTTLMLTFPLLPTSCPLIEALLPLMSVPCAVAFAA